jgi:hypothetical protein
LAVDASRRVHIVWPTLLPDSTVKGEPTLGLFYAMSRDGRQFTPRQRIDTRGVPRHPHIVIDSRGMPLVGWDEQVNGARHVGFGRIVLDAQGKIRVTRDAVIDDAPAAYPALAALPTGSIAAWTSGAAATSVIRVKRLVN